LGIGVAFSCLSWCQTRRMWIIRATTCCLQCWIFFPELFLRCSYTTLRLQSYIKSFQALGPGFAQFAEPVFQRCINLIQSQQLAKVCPIFSSGRSYLTYLSHALWFVHLNPSVQLCGVHCPIYLFVARPEQWCFLVPFHCNHSFTIQPHSSKYQMIYLLWISNFYVNQTRVVVGPDFSADL